MAFDSMVDLQSNTFTTVKISPNSGIYGFKMSADEQDGRGGDPRAFGKERQTNYQKQG